MSSDNDPYSLIPDFANQLAKTSLNRYEKLGKNGKPQLHANKAEWTILATILAVHCSSKDDYTIQVVSMGTGQKCLPFSQLSKDGQMIHDSHAEVLARRGFIKYLLQHPEEYFQYGSAGQDDKLVRKPGYTFHMYVSQSPCGDASMTAIADSQTDESKASFHAAMQTNGKNHQMMQQQVYKEVVMIIKNLEYFEQNQVDWTLNQAFVCPAARWNVLGIQSAMLSHIFDPIYLDSVVVGDLFERSSLERALYGRISSLQDIPLPYKLHYPRIESTLVPFQYSKSALENTGKYSSYISTGTSISWVCGMEKAEVIGFGKKQGGRKGEPATLKTRSILCQRALFHDFVNISTSTYRKCKDQAITYQQVKTKLLDQCFDSWVQTPSHYQDFGATTVTTVVSPTTTAITSTRSTTNNSQHHTPFA